MTCTIKKIDKMHILYGTADGNCKDCNRLKCYRIGDRQRRVYKCLNYGESNAESTDWRLYYQCCGKKNQECEVQAINIRIKKETIPQIEGQLKISDYMEG